MSFIIIDWHFVQILYRLLRRKMISKKELSMLHLQKEKERSDGAQTYFDDENNDEKGSKKV